VFVERRLQAAAEKQLGLAAGMIKTALRTDEFTVPTFQQRSAINTILPVMMLSVSLGRRWVWLVLVLHNPTES
jgi:hypothetical protein